MNVSRYNYGSLWLCIAPHSKQFNMGSGNEIEIIIANQGTNQRP